MFSQLSIRERKRLLTIFVVVLIAIILWLFAGPKGVFRYYRLRKEIEAVKTEASVLEKQNISITEEINRLENDPSYLEDVAREDYGLVRKNEIVFDFSKKSKRH